MSSKALATSNNNQQMHEWDIQALLARIDQMEKRIKDLENRNSGLESDVQGLKLQISIATQTPEGEAIQILPSVKVKNKYAVLSDENEASRSNSRDPLGREVGKPPNASAGKHAKKSSPETKIHGHTSAEAMKPQHLPGAAGDPGRAAPVSNRADPSAVEKNTLIITDSIGRDLDQRRLLRDGACFIKKLRNGKNIADAKDYIARTKIFPENVIVQVGTNTLVREEVNATKSELLQLITAIRAKFQEARIMFSPILPRTYDAEFNNKARIFNAAVKPCLENMDNCSIINQQKLWENRTRVSYYQRDGIHLSQVGTAVLARTFKLALRGESGPNPPLASSQHTYMSGTHKAPGSNINTRNLNERHQKSERHPYYGNYRDQSHIPAHITSRPGPQYSTLPPSGDPRTNRMSYAQSVSVTRTNLNDREEQNNHRTNNIGTSTARQNAFIDAMQKIARDFL